MINQSNSIILDGVTATFAVVGAIAGAVTNSVAAAAFPLAGACMLQIYNRRQLMEEIQHQGQHLTEAIGQKLQSVDTLSQQQNQHDLSLLNHQQQFQIFSEQFKQLQGDFSTQLQQQNHVHLSLFESQVGEMAKLQQLLEGLQLSTQNLESQQQQLTSVVDELKQIENVSQALLNSETSFEMYYDRGLSHQRLGDEIAAIADFSHAIQLNAHCAKAYHMRGLLRAKQGDRRSAVTDLRHAAKYYFDQGDLTNYQITRSLSKELCDGLSEDEKDVPTITQETFNPLTASHLFEVN